MDFLADIGLFAAKTTLIVGAILVVLIFIIQASMGRSRHRPLLEVEKLNSRFKSLKRQLQEQILGKKQFKSLLKDDKKTSKRESEPKASRVFVLDFHGDIKASAVNSLREEVTAILSVAQPGDEVVVRLESGGGLVTSYGLGASQLARFREAQVQLTVCVDKIAASGGYMMACVADKIVAAPFAVLGSIGVIAQLPNFHRVLKKHDIDYREVTAGEFKRTVSVMGEITEPGFEKFKSQIEETHQLFKQFIQTHRPKVDVPQVATGEHWYGTQALANHLIDELATSDDYLFKKFEAADVYRVQYHGRKRLTDRLSESLTQASRRLLLGLWSDLDQTRFGL